MFLKGAKAGGSPLDLGLIFNFKVQKYLKIWNQSQAGLDFVLL